PGTESEPAVLPSGPAGQKVKFEPEPGFYQGCDEVTSDKRWYFYWNGTTWSLVVMGSLPVPDVSGCTENGGYEGTAQDLHDSSEYTEPNPAKAKYWSAGTYTASHTAVKDEVLYRLILSLPSARVQPGVSEDWEPISGSGR